MTDDNSVPPINSMARRTVLGAAILGVTAAAAAAQSTAQPTAQPVRNVPMPLAPSPVALPFDPATMPGLSQRLLISHHSNNYMGAVNRLAPIRAELAAGNVPGFRLNGLKREELIAWNSKLLHEVYFACLHPAATAPDALMTQALIANFGSVDAWHTEFVAMGRALGGGSGWVLLTWEPHSQRLTNQWASDHSQTIAGGVPLVALDMYEHAYALDYGAAAGAYVDAYMAVLDWRSASRTFAEALR